MEDLTTSSYFLLHQLLGQWTTFRSCKSVSRGHHGIVLEKQHWQVKHSNSAKDQQEIKP